MVQAVVRQTGAMKSGGKITDMLAEKADIIMEISGRSNAGQRSLSNYRKICTIHFPSGVFYSHTTSIVMRYFALDIPVLINELNSIVERGVPMPKLLISDRAQIVMPYHILFDK